MGGSRTLRGSRLTPQSALPLRRRTGTPRVVRSGLFAVGLAHLLMTFLLRERTTCEPPGRLVRSFGLDRQDARACARACRARVAFTSPQSCLRPDHRLARAVGLRHRGRHASCSCSGPCRPRGASPRARPRAPRACRRFSTCGSTGWIKDSTADACHAASPSRRTVRARREPTRHGFRYLLTSYLRVSYAVTDA